jgi:aquaporin Z
VLPYAAVQVSGAIVAASALYVIASGNPAFSLAGGFAANGYGAHAPGGYSLGAGLLAEVILTMLFIIVILGSTDDRAPHGLAPIAIGLALTGIHLVGIPITNTSVNPARSTGPAVIVGGWALAQLWMFWIAPIVGATVGALVYNWMARPQMAARVAPTARSQGHVTDASMSAATRPL